MRALAATSPKPEPVTMPQPPPGESLQVLWTIWDLAFETGKWPTFGELDRRWDRQYETDVLHILSQLPEGLTNGFSTMPPPQDSTRIGLTVAGAAACQGARETLTAFLDFLRVATETEKAWRPPPETPEAHPSLTDQDYANLSHGLPAAGRQHLLQLLFRLIHSEYGAWNTLSGPDADGHWRVTFDRRIRQYRNVTDLHTYWTKRPKYWEPRPEAQTSGPSPELSSEDHRHEFLSAHPDLLIDVVLQWIYNRGGRHLPACQL